MLSVMSEENGRCVNMVLTDADLAQSCLVQTELWVKWVIHLRSTIITELVNSKCKKYYWKGKRTTCNQEGTGESFPIIVTFWNQCAYPALALPVISDSSPGDKSKQMLPREMSDGSCPRDRIYPWLPSLSPSLSIPSPSVALSVRPCPSALSRLPRISTHCQCHSSLSKQGCRDQLCHNCRLSCLRQVKYRQSQCA